MEPWKTAIVDAGPTHIRVRGHDVLDLMRQSTFTDLIYLLHHDRLPTSAERGVLDAILIGVADHGSGAPSCAAARIAASGNRQSPAAAIAAGVATIGDEHGGAGSGCMELIADGLERARRDTRTFEDVAAQLVDEARVTKTRLPGFGHRMHSTIDPRVRVLFTLAEDSGLAGDGIRFARALEVTIRSKIKSIPLNIDGAISGIISDMGIDWHYGKAFFIIPRVVGLAAHAVEEVTRERPFRAVSLKDVTYDGPPEREIQK